MNDLEHWSDEDLAAARDRAYREAARCWQEARAYPEVDDTYRMLTNSAKSAQDYWARLQGETDRRRLARGECICGTSASGICPVHRLAININGHGAYGYAKNH